MHFDPLILLPGKLSYWYVHTYTHKNMFRMFTAALLVIAKGGKAKMTIGRRLN